MTLQSHFQPYYSVTHKFILQLSQFGLVSCLKPCHVLLIVPSDYLLVDLSLGSSSAEPKLTLLFYFGLLFPEAQNSTVKYEFSNCEGGHLFSHRTWGRTGEGVWFLVTLPTCDFWLCTQSVEWKALLSSWLHSTAWDSQPNFSGQFKSAQSLACSLLCKWEGMSMCTGGPSPYQNFLS